MWQSENRRLRSLRRGDPDAFAAFVDTHGPVVLRLARRYARTEADAEDLTQEIFVALAQALPAFRGESRISTWVYRVALNHCLKHVERRRPESVPLDERLTLVEESSDGSPQRWIAQRELAEKVDSALAALTDGHREVVILHELHGLTYGECAEALGIPVGTVKSRLFHAFTKLRVSLDSYVRDDESVLPVTAAALSAARAGASPLTETRG